MFELLDVKWGDPTFGTPSGTVTWSSELGGDLPIAAGFDLADIEGALNTAFNAWENVAAIDFQQVASGGNISVDTASLSFPVVAQATLFSFVQPGVDTFSSVDIEFSDNQTWSPFGGSGVRNFYAIAVHEIGHAIGLGHPMPPDTSQIMNEVVSVGDLSNIDIAGAQEIYGTDAGDTVVTLTEPGGGDGGGGGGGGALGLLLGLLALVASFFTGGGGAAVAMAAASVYDDTDEGEDASDSTDPDDLLVLGAQDCVHGYYVDGETAAAYLPLIDFTVQPNPCGCVGLCSHIIEQDEVDEGLLV